VGITSLSFRPTSRCRRSLDRVGRGVRAAPNAVFAYDHLFPSGATPLATAPALYMFAAHGRGRGSTTLIAVGSLQSSVRRCRPVATRATGSTLGRAPRPDRLLVGVGAATALVARITSAFASTRDRSPTDGSPVCATRSTCVRDRANRLGWRSVPRVRSPAAHADAGTAGRRDWSPPAQGANPADAARAPAVHS